jgi:hypothetical protein
MQEILYVCLFVNVANAAVLHITRSIKCSPDLLPSVAYPTLFLRAPFRQVFPYERTHAGSNLTRG